MTEQQKRLLLFVVFMCELDSRRLKTSAEFDKFAVDRAYQIATVLGRKILTSSEIKYVRWLMDIVQFSNETINQ